VDKDATEFLFGCHSQFGSLAVYRGETDDDISRGNRFSGGESLPRGMVVEGGKGEHVGRSFLPPIVAVQSGYEFVICEEDRELPTDDPEVIEGGQSVIVERVDPRWRFEVFGAHLDGVGTTLGGHRRPG
jgi:hypothetical protein